MVKATLILEPAALTGTAKLSATAGAADVKFWTAANKGTEYAAGSALAVPGGFTAAGKTLTKDLWVEGVSPHTAQRGTKLRFDYDDASGFQGHDRASLTILGIDRIQFVGKNNSRNDDNTLDADPNWPAGLAPGSVRVFPDARVAAAGGAIEAAARDKVDVKVTLTVAPIEPVKFYFRSFDVDDPTSAAAPLDDETKDEDNRGTVPAREGAFPGAVGGVKEVTFDGKEKTFEFQVTMQPGDNFRIVGNGDRKFLLDLANPDSTLGADNADKQRIINKNITGTAAEKEIRDVSHYASDRVLTVWRFLHVERDHMAAQGAAEVFQGAGVNAAGGGGAVQGDDDVSPGGVSGDPDIALAQAEYRRTYVETVDDIVALNTTRTTAFVHNLLDANAAATGNGIRDVASVDRFWVIHVVGCYEGLPAEDYDPDGEAACYGFTPASCMIYFETIRDVSANRPGSVARGVLEPRIVLHESLHSVFVYWGGNDHATMGALDAATNRAGTAAQNQLNDTQKDIIRRCDRPRP
jgi:hypothetical protein